jgi:hypothetical protein
MTNRLVGGAARRGCGEENVHNLMQDPTLFDNYYCLNFIIVFRLPSPQTGNKRIM